MTIVFFIAGIILLIVGAEALVRGASKLAAELGISPLVIGLTVVAFGTSTPELAVSFKAALDGQAGITLGNIIGSNIFNILFVLGISALITPLAVSQQLIRLDVPIMIGCSVFALVLAVNGSFGRVDGLVLFSGLVIYIFFLVFQSRKLTKETVPEINDKKKPTNGWVKNIGFVIVGLVMLVLGSRWLVNSAVSIAQYFGVSKLVVGLTIVAVGTSLPEVVTSIVASIRGERDIAVGNVVGSNIFNIMAVLGLSSIVAPTGIEVSPAVIGFDLPIMIVVALVCLPIFFTGGIINRWEGTLLLGYYIAYTTYLLLAASHHDALAGYSTTMLYYAVPLTLVTLIVLSIREIQIKKGVNNPNRP